MAVLEETAAQLTPIQWQAVRAAGSGADTSRPELQPGKSQEVDLLLRIQGTIDVGEDGVTTRTARPSAVDVLAWVLASEFLDDVGRDLLVSQMRELAARSNGRLPEVDEGYVAMATMAVAAVSPAVKGDRKGAVRGRLRVGVVNKAQLSADVSGAVERSTRFIELGQAGGRD